MRTPDYNEYAKVVNGEVVVRHSKRNPWGIMGWEPEHARGFAAYIIQLADQAEREDPRVKQLVADLEAVEEDSIDEASLEDMAIGLIKKGYHK